MAARESAARRLPGPEMEMDSTIVEAYDGGYGQRISLTAAHYS